MTTLADIQAAVASQGTVIQSAETLLTELATKLQQALDDDDQDAMQAIVDDLNEQRSQLAAAVTANTPTAGTPGEGQPSTDQPAPAGDASEGDEPAQG